MAKRIFSGEPLPIPPKSDDPETEAYNRKVIDYLRRLSAKIDQHLGGGGQGAEIDTFSAYRQTDHSVTTNFDGVPWTHVLRMDNAYLFDAGSSVIEVIKPGFYLVHFDLEFDVSSTFPAEARMTLTNIGTLNYVRYSWVSIASQGVLSGAVGMPLISGVGFDVQALASGGGTILARGSKINVIRVQDDETGGTGGPPGSGWDPTGGGVGPPSWVIASD